MKTFEYQARDVAGATVTGMRTACDVLALDRELEEKGLSLTSAKSVAKKGTKGRAKLSSRELVSLTTQLSILLNAGVPILAGLRGIAPQMQTEVGTNVVTQLAASIQSGHSFSEALQAFPDSFDTVFCAAVRAGEMSGALPPVLENQARFLEWSAGIRSTTLQALLYPVLLVCAITVLVVVMVSFVLPRIVNMMPGGEENLPGPTLFLMGVSDFLVGNWHQLLGLGVVFICGGVVALRQDRVAIGFSRFLFRIPRLGDLLSMLAVSRFARTASTLQDAGCDMLSIIDVSSVSCGNRAYQASFAAVREHVAGGARLSDALELEPHMDPLLVQMTRVGEDTGELDTCLGKLSAYYDKEVPRMVSWFLALLEPTILVVAGGIVGFILLAAMLPMISLYENM